MRSSASESAHGVSTKQRVAGESVGRSWRSAALASLLLVHPGCAGFPPAPAYPTQDDAFSAPQKIERPGLAKDKPPALVLYPGDTITVDIFSTTQTTLSGLLLDAEGMVYLPLVGSVKVGGLRLGEAQNRIQDAQRQFDSLATVTIQMSGRGGHNVTVLGAVARQGVVQLQPAARVTDVIAAAGGVITQSTTTGPVVVADLDGAVVIRDGKTLPVSFDKAMRGDPKHNIYVRAGDHLYVPTVVDASISVLGQVGSSSVFPHRPGLRLSTALAQAGGVTVGADKGDIRVIRGTLTEPRVYRASLSDFVNGNSNDVMLQPGDIIFVSDHFIENLGEVIQLVAPILSLGVTSTALAVSVRRLQQSSTTTTKQTTP